VHYTALYNVLSGLGSIVGIVTGFRLDGPGIESHWGGRFSAPVQTGPGSHPASCTIGTGSFPGVKSGRGVTLTPHPHLAPWSRKVRAIPLLAPWAVRPVQGLSACTRVTFTFIKYLDDDCNSHKEDHIIKSCTVVRALPIQISLLDIDIFRDLIGTFKMSVF
jgi:hypothetical protein